ncbi:hypothetical protein [Ammoniphilus resinae]|uniref:Preprotein translocase subunit YajC n=1 Tax=Ammoniphilus resinae TaxID=861532 RepID=A0ABS4GNZ1_9BACL|nr:hypothetical protein [Ammoniphilus resinae]MBP1931997.1 preprotein translocase subunit YajC [Ammoniphilus resinae]
MYHIEWGTAIYQLFIFLLVIGVPILIIVFFLMKRSSKIKELEQRIEKLENGRD